MILKRHKSFIKDFRKAKLTDGQFDKFVAYIALLRDGENLPKEARDHSLNGEYLNTREFHLGGDLLVIYLLSSDVITLLRIGTHSQVFK